VDELRQAAAEVARRARHVRIVEDAPESYAASLPLPSGSSPAGEGDPDPGGSRADRAAYWLGLDAINFGSGWFPTLRKPEGSGYATIAAAWRRRHAAAGPFSAAELAALDPPAVAALMGQDPAHELMELFALSLRDLGTHLLDGFGGSALALVEAAGQSALALVAELGGWPCFADRSRYQVGDRQVGDREPHTSHSDREGHSDLEELSLPFLKRAQIAAADLQRAGVADWTDTGRLTMFADNLVPHVLRLDGVLTFTPELVARIDAGELIEHGSPEEVEIRACAVEAVERIVTALRVPATAAVVDQLLWERGQGARYKASPRHRSRTTAY
jgi:Potential Queuosine, Q, salvage protein family